ncbi:MAG: hypothetical protein ABJC04_07455, partial [Verrucomicrobiota bacterium]
MSSVVQSQGSGFLSFPAQRILQELPKGSVKISFGEVRQAAPSGTFFSISSHDNVLVELPLNEILLRLHPSLLARRQNQNKIIVPDEVTNVFGPRGEGISVSRKPAAAPKAFSAPPIPAIVEPVAPITMPRPAMPELPRPAAIPMPAASSLRVLATETTTINFAEPVLNVPLTSVSENWPDAIRQEIREFCFASVNVALPTERIEPALRAGKISFSWKQIRSWSRPLPGHPSPNEDVMLELPLKIVAPLFLQNHRPAKAQKKILVEEFPDLFAI